MRETEAWTVDMGSSLTNVFDVTVAGTVAEGAGARHVGTPGGTVHPDGRPLTDVVLAVGGFRVSIDGPECRAGTGWRSPPKSAWR